MGQAVVFFAILQHYWQLDVTKVVFQIIVKVHASTKMRTTALWRRQKQHDTMFTIKFKELPGCRMCTMKEPGSVALYVGVRTERSLFVHV